MIARITTFLGVFASLVLGVFILVQLYMAVPLPQPATLADAYWRAPFGQTMALQYVGLIVFVFQNVWILWVLPAFAMLFLWMALRHTGLGVSTFIEQIHSLETALGHTRTRMGALDDAWNTLTTQLDEVFGHSGDLWLVIDPVRGIKRFNRAAIVQAARTNPALETLEGRTLGELAKSEHLDKAIQRCFTERVAWSGEFPGNVPGQVYLAWLFPLGDDVALLLRDISFQRRDAAFGQQAEALLRQIVEESVRPVAVFDAQWRYLYASRKWPDVLGLNPTINLLGQEHWAIMPNFPPGRAVVEQQLASGQLLGNPEERCTFDGKERIVNWHLRPWRDTGGGLGGYIFTAVDVTDDVRLRQQLAQSAERENALAYSDSLTGLPNRQLFQDRLNMSLAQAYRQLGKIALLFLDLDGFKGVNDSLGHDYGDLLLKQVATRLKECVRTIDTVARLGGDEFTVILSVRDRGDAEQVAQKILQRISQPYDLNGKIADKVGTSIGIAFYPQDAAQASDLMKKADAAMYAAKQAGKRMYKFADALKDS